MFKGSVKVAFIACFVLVGLSSFMPLAAHRYSHGHSYHGRCCEPRHYGRYCDDDCYGDGRYYDDRRYDNDGYYDRGYRQKSMRNHSHHRDSNERRSDDNYDRSDKGE